MPAVHQWSAGDHDAVLSMIDFLFNSTAIKRQVCRTTTRRHGNTRWLPSLPSSLPLSTLLACNRRIGPLNVSSSELIKVSIRQYAILRGRCGVGSEVHRGAEGAQKLVSIDDTGILRFPRRNFNTPAFSSLRVSPTKIRQKSNVKEGKEEKICLSL